MIKENEVEEIINLINAGFDLKLIAFELDIPLEQLQEYKKQAELKKNANETSRKKNSNLKRKQKEEQAEKDVMEETLKEQEIIKLDYEKIIKKYKDEISLNPKDVQIKRNLLAFAYFKAGKIDEARNELLDLIDKTSNCIAYRQLIHLEKTEGNFDDAKLWAYDALDRFPNSIKIREQLISMENDEKDKQER